jgi:DNA-binding HxlR family transcriptional regulator
LPTAIGGQSMAGAYGGYRGRSSYLLVTILLDPPDSGRKVASRTPASMVAVISTYDPQAFGTHRVGLLARELLQTVGDTWSALAVFVLYREPLRFSVMKTRMDEMGPRLRRSGISHKVLSDTLSGLRRNGLVTRLDSVPAEYSLTELGRSFWAPMMAVHGWTARHIDEVEAARSRFDTDAEKSTGA